MKRSILYFSGMLLLLAVAAGCSSNVAPVTYPQVNYVQGQSYLYYAQVLDKNTDTAVAGSGDTITSKVIVADTVYRGMSNVTEIQNTHSHPASGTTTDTTYIAQSNGNYYHYNYGIELLNSNSTVVGVANSGKPIESGWVLEAKLSANNGDTWVGVNDTLNLTTLNGPVKASLTDSVKELADTTFTVGSAAKHSIHRVIFIAGLVMVSEQVDSYVSPQDGSVLNIYHPTTIESSATPGLRTVLIATK